MNTIDVARDGNRINAVIDGKVVPYLFDALEFVTHFVHARMNMFFFTCTCSIPGCAGWHEGFDVYVNDGKVSWVMIDPSEGDALPAELVFDFGQYTLVQVRAQQLLCQIAIEREDEPLVEDEDEYEYRLYGFRNLQDLSDTMKRHNAWMHKRGRYEP